MATFSTSSLYTLNPASGDSYEIQGGGAGFYTFTDGDSGSFFETGDTITFVEDGSTTQYYGAVEGGIIYNYYGSFYLFSNQPYNSTLEGTSFTADLRPFDTTTGQVVCFLRGTRLLMADGSQKAVEELAEGDLVATAGGGPEPVLFAGCTKHFPRYGRFAPEELPIRIRAEALGKNRPSRDLLVSGGHAIAFDRLMIPARTLVNGRSITVEADARAIEYWHVRLPRHALVVSEGVASESFKHTPKYRFLAQAAAYAAQFPEDVPLSATECELRYPDVLPRIRRGRHVGAVKARIEASADTAGYAAIEVAAEAA